MRRRVGLFGVAAVFCGCNALLGIESGELVPLSAEEAGAEAGVLEGGGADARLDTGPDVVALDSGAGDAAADADVDAPGVEPDAAIDAASDADASCGDVQTDPKNCGSCGHDCLGGACQAGACRPFVMASETIDDVLEAIAVSPTHVFYTDFTTGKLRRVPRTGPSTVETVYATSAGTSLGLDVAWRDGFVYFADTSTVTGRILRCPDTGCVGAPEVMLGSLDAPFSVALTTDGFVTSESTDPGRVIRCHALPCEASPEIVAASEARPQRVAVNGNAVAWTRITNAEGVRLRIGTDPITTPVGSFGVFSVALTSTEVIYGLASTAVRAIPLAGGASRDLAPATFVERLAVAGGTVFFSDNGGVVKSVAISPPASPVKTVASGQSTPKSLAADDAAVFWINQGNSTVAGIAR